MTNNKFIGGGFPGIRECIDEINIITKESREKREFAPNNIISITDILSKFKPKRVIPKDFSNISETFDIANKIIYDPVEKLSNNSNIDKSFDLNLINKPLKSKNTKHLTKRSTKLPTKRPTKRSTKRSTKNSTKQLNKR
jgi:hypothetical protein